MTILNCVRAAVVMSVCLFLAGGKEEKVGGVSGRIVVRTPDGKETPGDKVKVYLMLEGGGKVEIKQNCVNSNCKKRAFVDGKEIDITGLQTDQEIMQRAMKTPTSFYSDETSRQMTEWMSHAGERMTKRMEKRLEGEPVDRDADKKADCLDRLSISERTLAATEKWAADNRKTDQLYTTETSPDGNFAFAAVPEGNYYLVAYGSAGECQAVWNASVTVKSKKVTSVDGPKVLDACPPLK